MEDSDRYPRRNLGFLRYIVFAIPLLFIAGLFWFHVNHIASVVFWSFIIGNILYYFIGIVLAWKMKDNRAFLQIFLSRRRIFKTGQLFLSTSSQKNNTEHCISCGACRRACPMDVDVVDPSRKRINGTECILCLRCGTMPGEIPVLVISSSPIFESIKKTSLDRGCLFVFIGNIDYSISVDKVLTLTV